MKRPKARQVIRFETHERRQVEMLRSISAVVGTVSASWGDPGVAAHSACSVGQNNLYSHADSGRRRWVCAIAEDKRNDRGNFEANMASETRFAFLSGAPIAYVALVPHKPLPTEVFCTYHAE